MKANNEVGPLIDTAPAKKTLSSKAQISMPVTRIYHMMKNMTNDMRISTGAAVWLAAATDSLMHQVIEKSIDEKPKNRVRVTPRDILLAIDKYPSFAALFPNSIIVFEAGEDPSKAADLTKKTNKKRKQDENEEAHEVEGKKKKRRKRKSKDEEKHHEKEKKSLSSRRKGKKDKKEKSLSSRRKGKK